MCKFCREEISIQSGSNSIEMDKNTMLVEFKDEKYISYLAIDINYCPICGRRLNEKYINKSILMNMIILPINGGD